MLPPNVVTKQKNKRHLKRTMVVGDSASNTKKGSES